MRKKLLFISSVQKEFSAERMELVDYIRKDVLLCKFFEPFIFEEMPAYSQSPNQIYLDKVEQCDVYLGLFGNEYGNEDENGVSPTEHEYDLAAELKKVRLIFVKKGDKSARHPKENAFISKVEKDITWKSFSDMETLRAAVYAALIRYLEMMEIIRVAPFDASCDSGATLDDLDDDKIKHFIHLAREKRSFPLPENTEKEILLKHLDLIDDEGRPTNAAVLLFGKKPQKYFISSQVKCMQFYGTEVEKPVPSYQIYQGDVFELVMQATSFVMSRINNWTGLRNSLETGAVETRPELPLHAVQEAIVNAICHRDYTSNGSVQVMLFRDRLEIWNPGNLPFEISVQKLSEPHKSMPRNPLLANPMFRCGYIEQAGTGTEDIIKRCLNLGLKKPEFYQDEDFRVILWRQEPVEEEKTGEEWTEDEENPTVDEIPTLNPTLNPTVNPTVNEIPTLNPTVNPSLNEIPTLNPIVNPTVNEIPTVNPTLNPTLNENPTLNPTLNSQQVDRKWTESGQKTIEKWTESGQKTVERWTESGQKVDSKITKINLGETAKKILEIFSENNKATQVQICEKLNLTRSAVTKQIRKLQDLNLLQRIGSDKTGHWEVLTGGSE